MYVLINIFTCVGKEVKHSFIKKQVDDAINSLQPVPQDEQDSSQAGKITLTQEKLY